MSCSVNRWGSGTTCETPRSTELAKELQNRITAMNNERAKQDTIWNLSGSTTSSFESLTLSTTNGAITNGAITNGASTTNGAMTNGAPISNLASFKTCNS